MTEKEKLKLLQDVSNDVVDNLKPLVIDNLQALMKAVKALEIVLVAMGARDKPVTVKAFDPGTCDAVEILNKAFVKGSRKRRRAINKERKKIEATVEGNRPIIHR